MIGLTDTQRVNVEIELSDEAVKQHERLNEPLLSRITDAIDKLEEETPEGDIKKLQSKDGCRVRVGSRRIKYNIHSGRGD
jgi:mRNA-degrading endonuclease RelE of RelBE toxin-antitoxin system